MAPLIDNVPESTGGTQTWRRRVFQVMLVVGILLVSFWLTASIVDLSIYEAYNHYIDNLRAHLGINSYLANALSLVFLVPFFLGVKYYLFSFRDRKRKQSIGMAMLLSLGVAYNLALYFGTQNEHFDSTGHPIKFYALVPGGVVFADHVGIEPKYGVAFRPVTQENVRWLLRIQQGRVEAVVDPALHDWFDGVTRDPLLWYYTDADANFHFFDGPGYAPSTGAELRAVTPEIRQQWELKPRATAAEQSKRESSGNAEPAGGSDAGTIVIESATYGPSCNTLRGNDTSNLAGQCNGRSSCAYAVANARPGGDPARGCSKDYVAQYHCSGDPSNLRRVAHEAVKNEEYTIVLNCNPRRSIETATTLSSVPRGTNSDASQPSEPDDKSERPVAVPISTEMDEIMFVVNSCRFTGNAVICGLQFTNKGKDRDMRLGGQFGGTRIIDQSGREYVVEVLQLGVRECRGCAVVNKLVNDVPMSAGLRFASISSEISLISLLEINYSMDGGGRWSTVQFRGVPVSAGSGRRQ
jgi:hypothetical protein